MDSIKRLDFTILKCQLVEIGSWGIGATDDIESWSKVEIWLAEIDVGFASKPGDNHGTCDIYQLYD